MDEEDVERVARSLAQKMFGWDTVSVTEILETRKSSEVIAVVDQADDVLLRLWHYVEVGRSHG